MVAKSMNFAPPRTLRIAGRSIFSERAMIKDCGSAVGPK